MVALSERVATAADRLEAAFLAGTQCACPTAGDAMFDVAAGYEVLRELHARRRARGWQAVGRKIGFTNTTIWARYGVDRPMWSHVWDRTLVPAVNDRAEIALAGLMEPRIEPEIVFGLAGPLPSGDDPLAVLRVVAWVAPGVEIVQSPFAGWKFTAADCAAAYGLHGRLAVGSRVTIDESNRATIVAALPTMAVTLLRGASLVDSGTGANVLGNPVRALMHLRDVLATQPWAPPLAAGEIVTTGTITDAHSVQPGETWQARFGALGLRPLDVVFR